MAQTAAIVDIYINDNATFQDAWQYTPPAGAVLDFTGNSFELSVKASSDDVAALVTFTTGSGQIVTSSNTNPAVIHMNVLASVIQTSMPASDYAYDLIMLDTSAPAIRTLMQQGTIFVQHGVTLT